MPQIVTQRLGKREQSEIGFAIRYFTIISAITGLRLTQKQIELLAFILLRGTITPLSARKEFISMFSSSKGTIENLKLSLVKKGMVIKVDGKYRLNPVFIIDSSRGAALLQIKIEYGKPENGENTGS